MGHGTGLFLFIGTGDLYLHVQMLFYYISSLLLGLLLGYLLWGWGRRSAEAKSYADGVRAAERKADAEGTSGEVGRLKSELDILTKARGALETRLEKTKVELEACRARKSPPSAEGTKLAPASPAPTTQPPQPTTEPETAPETSQTEPKRLTTPLGTPDDLKRIKGVGAKLEKTLNKQGFFHYHQIAAWTDAEAAWVDTQLKFKGRIARDDWIVQARSLAASTKT